VTGRLRKIMEDFLGHSDFTNSTPLMDVGLDSIGATDLAYMLADEFSVHILSTFVFKYPTVDDIATHILALSKKSVQAAEQVITSTNGAR
jgi:acyl carrier protein